MKQKEEKICLEDFPNFRKLTEYINSQPDPRRFLRMLAALACAAGARSNQGKPRAAGQKGGC